MKYQLPLLLLSALLLGTVLSACRSEPWREYRIYCGQSFAGGSETIAPEEWESFCSEVVAKEFPDGFTVCDGDGWWRSQQTTLREKTKIIVILAPDDDHARQAVERTAAGLKERFQQEAILIVGQEAEVEFK